MRKISIPDNLPQILQKEGIWEDDSFDPMMVTIMEAEYKGREVIVYQMQFPAWEKLGNVNDRLKRKEPDGYEWEEMIRKYIHAEKPELEGRIHGDSEDETCVLWTETREDFEEMMQLIFDWIDAPRK